MTATPTPISFTGQLLIPADPSLSPDQVPFNSAANVISSQPGQLLNLITSGTEVVPFGTTGSPGAKLVAVRYDAQTGAAPVLLHFNGDSTHPIELTPGGFIILMSPNPAAGITSLSIDFTASCQLRVWIAG